jgi:hypothetical protein
MNIEESSISILLPVLKCCYYPKWNRFKDKKISSETAGELKEDMVIYQIYWNKRMKKN